MGINMGAIMGPRFGVEAGSGGGGIPEIVEDSATVPNTMEEVMRLAVPPE